MKATELRIGNWIMAQGLSSKVTIGMLKEIFLNSEEYGPDFLTEDWLEYMGFKQFDKEDNCWAIGYKEEEFGYSCDFEVNINKDNSWHVEIYAVTLEYVHQLQNLYFALTGKELEFKK